MTVEQSHLEYFGSQSPEAQMVLNQLKEITGVSNFAVLGQALEASKNASGSYDLDHAINILVDENSAQQQEMADPDPLPDVPESLKNEALSLTNSGVIDLTNDTSEKEDDLQKAIALSLKEHQKVLGGQVSMEDQDISRVVEASLAESKAVGTKRKRGEVWLDPVNPHDRKRNGDWPVGLKNVGNTCWFSAVIQSLFHLPVFRRLVLQFSPKETWSTEMVDTKERRNLMFMQELRKLFALMLCSKRKYVDPSPALEELKEAFPDSSAMESQQDVSEFSHKLLEWLEEAFKLDAAHHSNPQSSSVMDSSSAQLRRNPMLDLFYGHFRSEGQNEGHSFSNEEAFGQYPLQVNGFSDIHESLDSAMAQEIESCNDGMSKSVQESWFTRLPPVLLFELSRFQFNQHQGRPEKIHNKLEFPEVIFMDRYMEYNKEITRTKREQVRKLKDERDKLQTRLEKYLNYGSGPKRVPLQDVLQYTLEFVESRKSIESSQQQQQIVTPCTEDVEMASPSSGSSVGDSPRNSPHKFMNEVMVSTAQGLTFRCTTANQMPPAIPVSECEPMQEGTVPSEAKPSPLHVSDVELRVLQSCLRRWRAEVAGDVKELQDSIHKIDSTIKEIYSEESLQKEPYRLHAVLVHEGQAASGHYWAYVYSPKRQLWLKFNDITVTDATWSELQKESMGGHHIASAYCLMYVDQCRSDLYEETRESEMTNPDWLEGLPEDLQKYVEQDNYAFLQEMEQWDLEQSRKKDSSTMTPFGGTGDIDCAIVAEKKMVIVEDTEVPLCNSVTMDHAALALKVTMSKVDQFAKAVASHGIEIALEEALKQEVSRLRRIARSPTPPTDDSRLQHVGVYILRNSEAADPYLSWSILEQFTMPDLDEKPGGDILRKAALQKLETLTHSLAESYHATYSYWHEEYKKFRQLATLFVIGVESYHQNRFDVSLSYFIECCQLNALLMGKACLKNKGLDHKLLMHYRRQSVLKLNDVVAARFQNEDMKEAVDALSDAYEHIVPCMDFLASDAAPLLDSAAAEKIRSRWCLMLGVDIGSQKAAKLQDFLAKLLEPGTSFPKPKEPASPRVAALDEKFRAAMLLSHKSGEYQASQKS